MPCIYKGHTSEQGHGSGMNGKGNIWIAHDPLATGVPPIPWPTSPERAANPHTHIICHWSTHQTDSNLRTPTAIIHFSFLFTSQPINVPRTSPNLGRISVSLSGTNMTRHKEPFWAQTLSTCHRLINWTHPNSSVLSHMFCVRTEEHINLAFSIYIQISLEWEGGAGVHI